MGCEGCVQVCSSLPMLSLVATGLVLAAIIFFESAASSIITLSHEFISADVLSNWITAVVVVTGLLACYFLVIAFFSTGRTREKTCGGKCVNYCGRFATAFHALIAFAAFLFWLVLVVLSTALNLFFIGMYEECNPNGKCVNLRGYHMQYVHLKVAGKEVCGDRAKKLCDMVTKVGHKRVMLLSASVGVVIGFVWLLMAMAANYVHLKDEKKEDEEKQKLVQ